VFIALLTAVVIYRSEIYNDSVSNPGNDAGTLIANSGSVAVKSGWNTVPMGPVSLSAGTYWLAFQDDGHGQYAYGSLNKFVYTKNTFGLFQAPFLRPLAWRMVLIFLFTPRWAEAVGCTDGDSRILIMFCGRG
jgi:hypothetical protein